MRTIIFTILASAALASTATAESEMLQVGRTAAVGGDGQLQVSAHVDPTFTLASARETSPGVWSLWKFHAAPRFKSQPAMARSHDGRLELFGVAENGELLHTWQIRHKQTNQNTWIMGWERLGGNFVGNPTVARDRSGCLHVLLRGADGRMWDVREWAPSAGWSGPLAFGDSIAAAPAVGVDDLGYLHLFSVGADQRLRVRRDDGNGWFGGATEIGTTPVTGTPAAARNAAGKLQVFVRGTDNRIWESKQTVSSSWTAPAAISSATFTGSPSVAFNSDGRLEVVAVGSDGGVYHAWQFSAGSTPFSAFTAYPGMTTTSRTADIVLGSNGKLTVFAINAADRRLHAVTQVAPNSGWGAWTSLASPFLSPD